MSSYRAFTNGSSEGRKSEGGEAQNKNWLQDVQVGRIQYHFSDRRGIVEISQFVELTSFVVSILCSGLMDFWLIETTGRED